VEAILRLMGTDDTVTGPVNLGNPGEFTIRALAETVIRLTGSASKIELRALPSDDPQQRQPDIGMARELLAWEPAIALEAGLTRTIAYFDNLLSAESA
jgi:UDP-glucuronate decarboxylase